MKQVTRIMAILVVSGALYATVACGAKDGMKESSTAKPQNTGMSQLKVDPSMAKDAKVDVYKAKYPDISHEKLTKAMKTKNVFIVDANSPETYNKNRIPGAYTIHDTKTLRKALPKDKNALIITYCGSQKCTAWFKAADYMAGEGYTNIKHYGNGIKGWINRKEKTESSKEI